jgi:CRP/FNR family transcriptional regulator, cyclic AMP receptor protein
MTKPELFLNLVRNQEVLSFGAGQSVFKAGDTGETLYVVIDGEAEIQSGSIVLEIAGPGSIIGELPLIDDDPRSATVVAKTACRLVAIDRRRFQFMVQETPFFALAVMKVLADRLRKTTVKLPSD